jgi:hypothetical protein
MERTSRTRRHDASRRAGLRARATVSDVVVLSTLERARRPALQLQLVSYDLGYIVLRACYLHELCGASSLGVDALVIIRHPLCRKAIQ